MDYTKLSVCKRCGAAIPPVRIYCPDCAARTSREKAAERVRRYALAHPSYVARPDRHREGYWADRERTRQRPSRSKYPRPRPCLGVDGETVDDRYVLLAAASEDGWSDYVENPAGLTTGQCLDFLLSLPHVYLKWGFAFSYDVNMMLRPALITRPELALRLWQTNYTPLSGFKIEWLNRKMFSVRGAVNTDVGAAWGQVQIWDMFPWVQTSFARWLEEWRLADADTVERIRSMKDQRSSFAAEDMDSIRRYCLSECEHLARGASQLVRMVEEWGVSLNQWYSPATLAKAVMHSHRIVVAEDTEMERLARSAYFGGRSESDLVGPVEGPLYYADIHSAYSAAAVRLPCYDHGDWVHGGEVTDFSLCRVTWRPRRGDPHPRWGPFPLRPRTGSLRYPTHGTGWYWGVEVRAAMRHSNITVKEVLTWRQECDHRPFDYLTEYYDRRRMLKAEGNPLEYVAKTVLNSTYGALAEHDHKDEKPPYQCFRWASWITAATRARLLDAMNDGTVMMATDSMLSTQPLNVTMGDGLGQWEAETYDRAFLAGSGIYWLERGGAWEVARSRGFEMGRLDLQACQDLWVSTGRLGSVDVALRRHIGLGLALHRKVGLLRLWGLFVDTPVRKTFDQTPRREWLTADPWDGRSQAPTLTAHRALAEADEQAIADAREYLATYHLAHPERTRKVPSDLPELVAALITIEGGHIDRVMPDQEQPAHLIPE